MFSRKIKITNYFNHLIFQISLIMRFEGRPLGGTIRQAIRTPTLSKISQNLSQIPLL
jgi:hypothetical protein